MNKFKLIINGDGVRQLNLDSIKEAIYSLKDEVDSFVILEPKKDPIDNNIYIQAVKQGGVYIAETRFVFGDSNNFKHYTKIFTNRDDLLDVFVRYTNSIVPNIKDWTDDSLNNGLFVEDEEVQMAKLYKTQDDDIQYFEVWLNDDDVSLTIYTGIVGDVGLTEEVYYDEENDLPVKIAMQQLIVAQREMGYDQLPLFELIIQYTYSEKSKIEVVNELKDDLESLFNECLGWTGNGHSEGGDADNGVVNIYCYVVNKEIALSTILNTLKAENILLPNLKIGYADEKTEEYISMYPSKGIFNLM